MSEKFTVAEFKVIRVSIQNALDIIAKDHNLSKLSLGNIRGTNNSFSSKIEATRLVEGADTLTPGDSSNEKAETDLETSCWVAGVRDKGCTTKTYIVNGHPCKINEVKFKNRAYPIIVEATDGSKSRYKLSVIQLKNCQTVL